MVNEVTAEGEAFASTARGTRHKSAAHSAVVFNLRVEVKFYGRATVGDSTIGSAAGKITLASAACSNRAASADTSDALGSAGRVADRSLDTQDALRAIIVVDRATSERRRMTHSQYRNGDSHAPQTATHAHAAHHAIPPASPPPSPYRPR